MSKLVEEMEDNEDDVYLAPELFDSNSGSSKAFLSFLSWLTSSQSLYSNFEVVYKYSCFSLLQLLLL